MNFANTPNDWASTLTGINPPSDSSQSSWPGVPYSNDVSVQNQQPTVQVPKTPVQEAQQVGQQNHNALVQAGNVPVGGGQYIHQSMLTPDEIAMYMNNYKQQAQQIYPSNAVFGDNSSFAQSHPRAAAAISNILLAGSQARAGMTIGDSIGVASRMALAPQEYAQQQAFNRNQYVNQQTGNLITQQKNLSDISEANARTGLYGSEADYYSGAKTDAAFAQAQAATLNAQTRAQSAADRVANWTANRIQKANEFTQSDNTKRYVVQFRAMHPADQVNQAAITQRNFQSHMAMLDQQEARDVSRPNPLTGAPLTPEDKQAIHENYEQERQNETDAYGYIHQQQQDAMGSSSTSSSPKPPKTNPTSNTPPASMLKSGVHSTMQDGSVWTLGPNNQPLLVKKAS